MILTVQDTERIHLDADETESTLQVDESGATLQMSAPDEVYLNAINDLATLNVRESINIGGTGDYEDLENKPSINGVELIGDKSTEDLHLDQYVPTTRTVNGKALSSDITLTASDVNAVPTTRTVNSKALSSDITLDADDVGALPTTAKSALFYGEVDSTSTSTEFTAQIDGITEYFEGLTVILKNGVVTSASGFTININGLGAKPVYTNLASATRDTTIFNANYTFMFVYENRVSGGDWLCYRGYDANTNTIGYQLRTNSQTMPMTSAMYRYRLMFTSADGAHYVPATNSTSTNATASRAVCQDPINPWGAIYYYGYTTAISAGSSPSASYLWEQYAVNLGYSFNRKGSALTLTTKKPVYVVCAPQTDGSAIIDATTPYTQDLPSTEDGMIYIFLGIATASTTVEIVPNHPVYEYKDGKIKLYVG